MMQRDMPGSFATLRETANDDAIVVNIEALLHGGDGLEDVPFAGPMPAGAVDAAEAIELDLSVVGDGRIAGHFAIEKAINELGFGGVVLTAVQPDVESRGLGGIVVFRQCDAIRENCAIDFGNIGMDLLFALIPLGLIRHELIATLDPLIECDESMLDRSLIA